MVVRSVKEILQALATVEDREPATAIVDQADREPPEPFWLWLP
jgi:hypothetical protein